ncbi:MAG: DUF1571 domain-containing protein, partial [Saprospiraceae bacterium]|nr:DUF1571 domain-containing protein [Saprospiraceae bacterium]
MIKFIISSIALLGVLSIPDSSVVHDEVSAYDVTKRMISETKEINGLSYTMKRIERIEGQLNTQVSKVKLSRSPFRVYTKQEYPKAGIEVLYAEGTNHGKALVNPNGFPWINLKLDPLGRVMRKNQHHTIINS